MYINHPHIIRYINADDKVPSNYIIAIEKQTLLQCSSLLAAIFVLFAVHYVFNVEYYPEVKDFYLFLQSKLFDIKESTSFSTSYVTFLQLKVIWTSKFLSNVRNLMLLNTEQICY